MALQSMADLSNLLTPFVLLDVDRAVDAGAKLRQWETVISDSGRGALLLRLLPQVGEIIWVGLVMPDELPNGAWHDVWRPRLRQGLAAFAAGGA